MPRNSVSSLMLAAAGPMIPGDRLAPPADLTGGKPARDEWNRIVNTVPPGFITAEHETLMRELVRHTLFARAFGEMAEGLLTEIRYLPPDNDKWRELKRLLDRHSQQTEKVQKLSRALHITKASHDKTERAAAKRSTSAPAPWLDWSNTPAAGEGERGRNRPLD